MMTNLIFNLLSFVAGGVVIWRIYIDVIPDIQERLVQILLSALR